MPATRRITRAEVLGMIFTKPTYITVAVAGAILNYLVFLYFIEQSNRGVLLFTIPAYLVYPLMLAGGMLIAISAYSFRINAIRPAYKASDGVLGFIVPAIGSMISSCACSYPIFATVLLALGADSFSVSSLVSIVGAYQQQFVALIILANLLLIHYYLGVVARGCSTAPRRAKSGGFAPRS